MSDSSGSGSVMKSRFDGQDIFYRQWTYSSPSVCIYLVHGISEHSGRYSEFGSGLSSALHANVFAIDHRAHGRTACPEGSEDLSKLGLFNTSKDKGTLNCLKVMGSDLAQLIEETSGDLPVVIFGHSMGSVVTRWCLRVAPAAVHDRIKGVVLSGVPAPPAVLERFPLLVLVSSAIAIGRGRDFLHNFVVGRLDSALRSRKRNKKLPKDCFMTSVLEEIEKFHKDPLCGQTLDLHIWKAMRSTLIELESPREFYKSLGEKRMPILFISGKDDPVCAFGKASSKCARAMAAMGFPVTEVLLDDCIHEFLHETPPVKQKGIDETISWIKSKL